MTEKKLIAMRRARETRQHTGVQMIAKPFTYQGQTILKQSGRDYLSAGGTMLTRETDLRQMQGGDGEPVHMVLVYNKQ